MCVFAATTDCAGRTAAQSASPCLSPLRRMNPDHEVTAVAEPVFATTLLQRWHLRMEAGKPGVLFLKHLEPCPISPDDVG